MALLKNTTGLRSHPLDHKGHDLIPKTIDVVNDSMVYSTSMQNKTMVPVHSTLPTAMIIIVKLEYPC